MSKVMLINSNRTPITLNSEDGDTTTIQAKGPSTVDEKFAYNLPEGVSFAHLETIAAPDKAGETQSSQASKPPIQGRSNKEA